ncbi:Ribosomal large subunit pseudouridine synthase B [hydrothermal vent metagenome]|uniref:Ribosomal large subunit pseudouridine synthase B n=1 Tax=hydrothermal vent metagenome TaxID=652676 RepID=A0A1W1BYC8_9ZZZZ
MRLNKYISHNSKYSRRDADKLIEDGEVTINRKVVREFGREVGEDDFVEVKGRAIKVRTELTVIVYNKPKGVLVTKRDDRDRTTIYHKLPGKFRHFIPVGRLDYASEGLLILTDSPDVADKLMKSSIPRTYNLKIDKPLSQEMIDAMRDGLVLSDARAGGHEKSRITSMEFAPFDSFELRSEGKKFTKLRVTISEGQNRELRRFFAHFGAEVLDLKRVSFGDIGLNNLPTNKTRYYTRREYSDLYDYLKQIDKIKQKEEKSKKEKLIEEREVKKLDEKRRAKIEKKREARKRAKKDAKKG